MKRRHLLSILTGASAGLASCNSAPSGTVDGDRTSRTTTASTSGGTGDATSEDIRAIEDASRDLEDAYAYLGQYDLVENGSPRLTRDHVSGYEKQPVTDAAAAARRTLQSAAESATGDDSARLESFISLSDYTEAKGNEYLYLIAGQISMFDFKVQFGRGDEYVPEAFTRAETAKGHFQKAHGYLERVEGELSKLAGTQFVPSVEGFDLGSEQREVDVLRDQLELLLLTSAGFLEYTRGLIAVTDGSVARDNEDWREAESKYALAASSMEKADEYLRTVEQNDPEYHRRMLSLFVCQTAGWAEGMELIRKGVSAKRNGDVEAANEHVREGSEILEDMYARCVPSTTTTSPATTGSGG